MLKTDLFAPVASKPSSKSRLGLRGRGERVVRRFVRIPRYLFAGGTVKVLLPLIVRCCLNTSFSNVEKTGADASSSGESWRNKSSTGASSSSVVGSTRSAPVNCGSKGPPQRLPPYFPAEIVRPERTFDAFARRVHIGGAFVLVGLLERQRSEPFSVGGEMVNAPSSKSRMHFFSPRPNGRVGGEHVRKRRADARRAERLIQIKRPAFASTSGDTSKSTNEGSRP